ncbi:MAG: VOC family protein [Chloroflexota bacterium]
MHVNPYLAFAGDCTAAFRFYEESLGGTILFMQTYGESQAAGQAPPESRDHILHASMRIGDTVLMGSDLPPGEAADHKGFFVCLEADSAGGAERLFGALANGGTVTMPIEQTFFATRFGMLIDRFGIPWIVNFSEGSQ